MSSSPAAANKQPALVLSSLNLRGSNGYTIDVVEVTFNARRRVVLAASKGLRSAQYSVPATGPRGIHARLPGLGVISLAFKRRHRSVKRFGPHCKAVAETGVFKGTVRFDGELGYTSIDRRGGRGEVERLPNGFCDAAGERATRRRTSLPFRTTDLLARTGTGSPAIEFTASRFEPGSAVAFEVSRRERRGAMRIRRAAIANGGARSFRTSAAGRWPKSAMVAPPKPFRGRASFEQPRAGSPPSWAGSLRIDLPGAELTDLVGDGFTARLCVSCALRLPFRP